MPLRACLLRLRKHNPWWLAATNAERCRRPPQPLARRTAFPQSTAINVDNRWVKKKIGAQVPTLKPQPALWKSSFRIERCQRLHRMLKQPASLRPRTVPRATLTAALETKAVIPARPAPAGYFPRVSSQGSAAAQEAADAVHVTRHGGYSLAPRRGAFARHARLTCRANGRGRKRKPLTREATRGPPSEPRRFIISLVYC
jgi:hypothetical protein